MEAAIIGRGMTTSYESIVTVHGEVLHNERYDGLLAAGDLLLADVGAETPEGWAGDVTRTWPVSGRFEPARSARCTKSCSPRSSPPSPRSDPALATATCTARPAAPWSAAWSSSAFFRGDAR